MKKLTLRDVELALEATTTKSARRPRGMSLLEIMVVITLIGLVTKLISDLCYVWVDPRVKFD